MKKKIRKIFWCKNCLNMSTRPRISFDKNQILNSLSKSDIEKYREAYVFQEQCKWKSANKHILKISDTLLMGHILAQRYLHPKCYTSKYLELYYWLKKYNDHPQAKRIYRLAIKRMPKGYKSPSKPINPSGIVGDKVVSKKSTK